MVFLVVMHGCESWAIKKAEQQRTDAFEQWCWRRLESPWNCKEIKPVQPKGNQSWIFIGRSYAEAEAQILLQRAGLLEKIPILGKTEGRRRRGWQRMRWLDGIMDSMDMVCTNAGRCWRTRKAWHATFHGVANSHTRLHDKNSSYYKIWVIFSSCCTIYSYSLFYT